MEDDTFRRQLLAFLLLFLLLIRVVVLSSVLYNRAYVPSLFDRGIIRFPLVY